MTEQEIDKVLNDIEDACRRGYSVGYAEGYCKGKDPNTIERGTLTAVLTHMLESYKAEYTNGND